METITAIQDRMTNLLGQATCDIICGIAKYPRPIIDVVSSRMVGICLEIQRPTPDGWGQHEETGDGVWISDVV